MQLSLLCPLPTSFDVLAPSYKDDLSPVLWTSRWEIEWECETHNHPNTSTCKKPSPIGEGTAFSSARANQLFQRECLSVRDASEVPPFVSKSGLQTVESQNNNKHAVAKLKMANNTTEAAERVPFRLAQ